MQCQVPTALLSNDKLSSYQLIRVGSFLLESQMDLPPNDSCSPSFSHSDRYHGKLLTSYTVACSKLLTLC